MRFDFSSFRRQCSDMCATASSSAGHARTLLGTPDRIVQEQLANEAVHRGLSVRSLEELVRAAVREAQAEETALEECRRCGHLIGARRGPDRRPEPRGRGRSLRPPGVHDLEELLEDRLNTRVKVDMGGKRGKLVIEFATLDDLERIYRVIIGETFT